MPDVPVPCAHYPSIVTSTVGHRTAPGELPRPGAQVKHPEGQVASRGGGAVNDPGSTVQLPGQGSFPLGQGWSICPSTWTE